jgi:hypothetical protein
MGIWGCRRGTFLVILQLSCVILYGRMEFVELPSHRKFAQRHSTFSLSVHLVQLSRRSIANEQDTVMLAHLKTKGREQSASADPSVEAPDQPDSSSTVSLARPCLAAQVECPTTKLTCDALCSLSYTTPVSLHSSMPEFDMSDEKRCSKRGGMGCPKQEHQLPMFLSSKS